MPANIRESPRQQLRSDLAYEGLATAVAEAPPGQLARVRGEEIGHTEIMEQLLRIEVEATRARRWKMRMRLANASTSWTLEDFAFAAQPGVDCTLGTEQAGGACLEDVANVPLIGPPGVGKTMNAAGRIFCSVRNIGPAPKCPE